MECIPIRIVVGQKNDKNRDKKIGKLRGENGGMLGILPVSFVTEQQGHFILHLLIEKPKPNKIRQLFYFVKTFAKREQISNREKISRIRTY